MGNIAIIPARGGSKRIPRKNIKIFHGKPIIAYSIETAFKTELFEEIIVSTEDEEIAEVAIKYGAKVPFFRSIKNADDFSTTADVLVEVLENYEDENKFFTNACCIYPTAPFITINDLKNGYNKLINENRDTVIPIVPFSYSIWRGLELDEDEKIKMIWPENLNKRSQDLKEVFHDAGQWYWINVDIFKKNKILFTDNSSALILNPRDVQDIDNLSDWSIAELKYKINNTNN